MQQSQIPGLNESPKMTEEQENTYQLYRAVLKEIGRTKSEDSIDDMARNIMRIIFKKQYIMPPWSYGCRGYGHLLANITNRHTEDLYNLKNKKEEERTYYYTGHIAVFAEFIKYGSRVYVPTKELVSSLDKTSLSGGLFSCVHMPLPTVGFTFPTGLVKTRTAGNIMNVIIRREENLYRSDGRTERGIDILAIGDEMHTLSSNFSDNEIDNKCTEEFDEVKIMKDDIDVDFTENEIKDDCYKLNNLIAKLLMFMNFAEEDAKPEEYSHTTKTKGNLKKAAHGNNTEWWKPWIIGIDHAKKVIIQKGTHTSPSMHWRCGHWRLQKYGKNLCNTKNIWIQPVLIGKS